MQLKNNKSGNVQFFFLKKEGKEVVTDFVHLPGNATVEIDDDIYAAMCKSKTEVEVLEERVVVLDKESVGANVELGDVAYTIKEYYPTGKRKTVSLVQHMISKGDLTVVERPGVSLDEMKKVINEHGVSVKDMADDAVMALYDKLA